LDLKRSHPGQYRQEEEFMAQKVADVVWEMISRGPAVAQGGGGGNGSMIHTAAGAASVPTIQGVCLEIAGREYHPANVASIPRAL
jgi:hypothetical protein